MSRDPVDVGSRRAAMIVVIVCGAGMIAVLAGLIWLIVAWPSWAWWAIGGFMAVGALPSLTMWIGSRR